MPPPSSLIPGLTGLLCLVIWGWVERARSQRSLRQLPFPVEQGDDPAESYDALFRAGYRPRALHDALEPVTDDPFPIVAEVAHLNRRSMVRVARAMLTAFVVGLAGLSGFLTSADEWSLAASLAFHGALLGGAALMVDLLWRIRGALSLEIGYRRLKKELP